MKPTRIWSALLTGQYGMLRPHGMVLPLSLPHCERLDVVPASDLKLAREEALREAADAVVRDCSICDGNGFTVATKSGHACGGDEALCQRVCPVPVKEQEQCEYCGRPTAAILALLEKKESK